jgi:hypothetical protein
MGNNRTHEKPAEPVAVLTLRTVKPGYEERFEAELHDFIARRFSSAQKMWVERTIFSINFCRPVVI